MDLIIQLSAFVGGIVAIAAIVFKGMKSNTKDFKNELQDIKDSIDNLNYESCKTELTNFLSELENGIEKSAIQIQRACEIYDRYMKLNGNSYIREKWESLKNKM